MKKENDEPLFRRSLKDYSRLPEAHILYRKILAQHRIVPLQLFPQASQPILRVYWILLLMISHR